MKFVVGIGNHGEKYEGTRHNIGFRAVDGLAAAWGKAKWEYDRYADADVTKPEEGTVLLKPRTFVNLTGKTAAHLQSKMAAGPSDILIVCDDVNLVFGKLRLRKEGSAGGHNGLQSVIDQLGTQEFPRLRIGVGSSVMPKDLTDFVLGRFDREEEKAMPQVLDDVVAICRTWVKEGFEPALDRLSRSQSNKGS